MDARFAVPRLHWSLAARTPSASLARCAGYDVSEAFGHDCIGLLRNSILAKPLGEWLAGQLAQAITDAIAGLSLQEERIKKVEIIDLQP